MFADPSIGIPSLVAVLLSASSAVDVVVGADGHSSTIRFVNNSATATDVNATISGVVGCLWRLLNSDASSPPPSSTIMVGVIESASIVVSGNTATLIRIARDASSNYGFYMCAFTREISSTTTTMLKAVGAASVASFDTNSVTFLDTAGAVRISAGCSFFPATEVNMNVSHGAVLSMSRNAVLVIGTPSSVSLVRGFELLARQSYAELLISLAARR